MEWAGVGIIVGVQVAAFLYTLRRLDSMQNEIAEVSARVARLEGIISSGLPQPDQNKTAMSDVPKLA